MPSRLRVGRVHFCSLHAEELGVPIFLRVVYVGEIEMGTLGAMHYEVFSASPYVLDLLRERSGQKKKGRKEQTEKQSLCVHAYSVDERVHVVCTPFRGARVLNVGPDQTETTARPMCRLRTFCRSRRIELYGG